MIHLFWIIVPALIIWIVTTIYKKVDTSVDDYKLKRNPTDIKTLEKQLMKLQRANEEDGASAIADKILEYDRENVFANMVKSISFFEAKDITKAEIQLTNTVTQIFPMHDLQKLCNTWHSLSSSDNFIVFALAIAKTYYYYGYVCYIKGQHDQAADFKAKSKNFSRTPARKKLY